MTLANSNALITVQDGLGALQSPASGAAVQVTPGAQVTFALASVTGVARWALTFICPAYPSLHQRTFDWYQGQANALTVPMPAESISGVNPISGMQVVSVVSDGASSIGSVSNFVQTRGANAVPMQHAADYVIVTALPAYTNTNGNLVGNANGAITSTMADGAAPAVGDFFLLEQGRAAAAADVGVYQIVAVGAAGAKFQAQLAPDWVQGSILLPKAEILIGPRGSVFKNTTWVNTLTGLTNLIGTASFTFFPRQVTWSAAAVSGIVTAGASNTSGAPAAMSVISTTLSNLVITRTSPSGTASTVDYAMNSAGMVAGGLGTGAASAFATVAAGTVNASDVSTLSVTLINPC